MRSARPLLDLVPALAPRWLELFASPTPLRRLEALGAATGHDRLWLKDDAAADGAGSGSKLRKLEPLLGDAVGRGARSIWSFGAEGGSHVLAVAGTAAALGREPRLLVSPQAMPAGSAARAHFDALERSGARRIRLPLAVRLLAERLLLAAEAGREGRSGGRYVVPSGGSNALGCLGAVNAALELADQMSELPDELFVACGSCGLSAGLDVGFAMLGAPVRVVAVDASSRWHPSTRRLAHLVRATDSLLRRHGCRSGAPRAERWRLERPPARTDAAAVQELASRCEGLALDEVYTAPALAACLERARSRPDLSILFWNSCGRLGERSGAKAPHGIHA